MIDFNSECQEFFRHDFKHKQSILSDKNCFALTNSNLIIKKVLMSKRFFKKNSNLKFNFSSWKDIMNNDFNNNDESSSSSWTILIISFKTWVIIKSSDKLFSESSKILEHDLNSLLKRLNQKSNEYFISDVI